ncbi:MAG: YfdX family protein [Tangfeifania sp.]
MKTKLGYILVFILMVLFGCDRKDKTVTEPHIGSPKKPEETYLTEKQIQTHVDKEINLAIDLGNENIIQEAADVIALTRSGISSILNEKYADAIENIDKALAKADLIIRSDHPTKIISEVNIEVIDRVENAEEATEIILNIDSLMELGELQQAKNLMTKLTSELRITRESISISDYYKILKNANQLLKEKEREKALRELNSMLSGITIERSITPLPLIIAQKMVNEMEKLTNNESPEKEDILVILNNARYQIRFSEMLGYGKTEEEYQHIYNRINEIETRLNENNFSGVKKRIQDIDESLKQLQSDISVYTKVNSL